MSFSPVFLKKDWERAEVEEEKQEEEEEEEER